MKLLTLLLAGWLTETLAPPTSSALAAGAEDPAIQLVAQIRRADYEGDRTALQRLREELKPVGDDKKIVARLRYWRGFALWRRALNGFNDKVDPTGLAQDLTQAVEEFDQSIAADPSFVDAKVGAVSCLLNLVFLNQKDEARVRELLTRAVPMMKEAQAAEPDDPRLLWVVGSSQFYRPPEQGGGQAKGMATYERGLEAARKQKTNASDPLQPSWGEPELLMNLAWSNLNATTPDLNAAERYAVSALELVPNWHYVRDILLPQIRSAKAGKS